MQPVEFFFDFVSPYSYLAHSQFGTLGAPVRPVPIAVLELMKLVNNTPTTITCSVKRAYAGKDLGRWSARYGVPIAPPDMSRVNGALLLRIATAAEGLGLTDAVVAALFKAVWGGGGDASPEGVPAVLEAAGLPADKLLAAADDPQTVKTLEAATQRAAELGVFGAPTFLVAGELYFGNDRLDFVREALAAQRETV